MVFVPQLAIFKVAWVELPATLRLVEPRLQTLSLFLLGYVQHELQDSRAVLDERLFEDIDLLVALFDGLLGC